MIQTLKDFLIARNRVSFYKVSLDEDYWHKKGIHTISDFIGYESECLINYYYSSTRSLRQEFIDVYKMCYGEQANPEIYMFMDDKNLVSMIDRMCMEIAEKRQIEKMQVRKK